ncbi:MAG: exonuclease domain-containing protein [Micrococcales bacterium]
MNDSQLSFDFDAALPAWASKLAVFDLETTGLDLREARIVTACAVEIDSSGAMIGSQEEWLADPGIEIPLVATNVHGVSTAMAVEHGKPAKQVVSELLEVLRAYLNSGIPVVAYNAPYDFTILHYEALRHGLEPLDNPSPVLDPYLIDRWVDRYRGGKRNLEFVAQHYGVQLSDAHNATADAVAAGRVMQAIARKFAGKLPDSLDVLHSAQVQWCLELDANYEAFRRRTTPDFTLDRGWPIRNV